MNTFEYYIPTRVIFGKNAEAQAGEACKAAGAHRVLVHFGGGSVQKSGLLDRTVASLEAAGLEAVLLGGVLPNPRLSKVQEGIRLCREKQVDFILAVGGGSTLDSAKAIALGVPYAGDVWDFYARKAVPTAALPHGNILTLAATGSEMSNSTVITNEDGMLKRGFKHDFNRARFALMNPELLYTLPPYQTACGIVDIMMHTLERYFSDGGSNELTDRLAEALLRTVIDYGAKCMEQPEDYEARSEILWAGSVSHNGLTGLGRSGDWATHQIEHELSAEYDVAHGAGLAAVWGGWAKYVYTTDVERFVRFGEQVWGLPHDAAHPEHTALLAIDRTRAYFRSLGMPITISELLEQCPSDETLRKLADRCTNYGGRIIGNLRVLKAEDIYFIYQLAKE